MVAEQQLQHDARVETIVEAFAILRRRTRVDEEQGASEACQHGPGRAEEGSNAFLFVGAPVEDVSLAATSDD